MSENSKIEWTDHTFNPWTGCTKVSPGCAHCYAESWSKRSGIVEWGPGKPRRRTSEANWRQPLKWNRLAGKLPEFDATQEREWHRPRVFCASLADWLDPEVPVEWLVHLLQLIHATPNLDWLLLTKRPELWRERMGKAYQFGDRETERQHEFSQWLAEWTQPPAPDAVAPDNVWIGTTVEDQERADQRIPAVLSIPAEIRFLSCEPLLGPVNLQQIGLEDESSTLLFPLAGEVTFEGRNEPMPLRMGGIHWVIAGGESGHHARPMHPAWLRSIRDQARSSYVPFLFKQWGEWLPRTYGVMADEDLDNPKQQRIRLSIDGKNSQTDDCDCSADVWMGKVGKAKAGRLLDGRQWNEFPTGREVTQ